MVCAHTATRPSVCGPFSRRESFTRCARGPCGPGSGWGEGGLAATQERQPSLPAGASHSLAQTPPLRCCWLLCSGPISGSVRRTSRVDNEVPLSARHVRSHQLEVPCLRAWLGRSTERSPATSGPLGGHQPPPLKPRSAEPLPAPPRQALPGDSGTSLGGRASLGILRGRRGGRTVLRAPQQPLSSGQKRDQATAASPGPRWWPSECRVSSLERVRRCSSHMSTSACPPSPHFSCSPPPAPQSVSEWGRFWALHPSLPWSSFSAPRAVRFFKSGQSLPPESLCR